MWLAGGRVAEVAALTCWICPSAVRGSEPCKDSTPGRTRGSLASSTQSPSVSPHGMAFSSPRAPYTTLQLPQPTQSSSSAQVLNSRLWVPRTCRRRMDAQACLLLPSVTGPSAQVWLGPHSDLSLACKPQASNHRTVHFLGEIYSFIDPIFTGAQVVGLCSAQRQLPCLPAVPPPSLCTDKGPAWITFKAIWQRPWGCLGPELQRLCWAYYPLASCPLGTLGLPTGCLGPAVPPP